MDKKSYCVRLESWAEIIDEANKSGLCKKTWCEEHGIPVRRFYYWQSKVRQYLLDQQELSPESLTESGSSQDIAAGSNTFYEIEVAPSMQPDVSTRSRPLDSSATNGLILETDGFRLHIGRNTTEDLLASVVRVMKNA